MGTINSKKVGETCCSSGREAFDRVMQAYAVEAKSRDLYLQLKIDNASAGDELSDRTKQEEAAELKQLATETMSSHGSNYHPRDLVECLWIDDNGKVSDWWTAHIVATSTLAAGKNAILVMFDDDMVVRWLPRYRVRFRTGRAYVHSKPLIPRIVRMAKLEWLISRRQLRSLAREAAEILAVSLEHLVPGRHVWLRGYASDSVAADCRTFRRHKVVRTIPGPPALGCAQHILAAEKDIARETAIVVRHDATAFTFSRDVWMIPSLSEHFKNHELDDEIANDAILCALGKNTMRTQSKSQSHHPFSAALA